MAKEKITDAIRAGKTDVAGASAPTFASRSGGHTILGLIHDPIAQDLLMEIAVEQGYGLFCATGAQEAAQLLSEDPPHLLVIDVDGADGRALLSIARAHPGWKLIPVLAITATNNPMMAVSVDAPVFFKPELAGFEDAVTGRFQASRRSHDEGDDEEVTLPWVRRTPTA